MIVIQRRQGRGRPPVADQGQGIPETMSVDRPPSLGFKVIMATVRQFNAGLEIRRLDPGTEVVIHFPQNFGAPSQPATD